ncbi:MAG: DNA recombination protein RmuC [Planctomycetota bacterium]|nr:DNA recombination protein RmuC [Planctomycetota bacterium]
MATTLAIVFGLTMVLLGGLAAWLWRGQGKAAAEAAAATEKARRIEADLAATREAAIAAADAAQRDAATLRERTETLTTALAGAQVTEAKLRKDIEAMQEQFAAQEAATQEQFAERERSLQRERQALERQIAELDTQMAKTFEALSAKSLRAASDEFLKRAKEQLDRQQEDDAAELEKRKTAVEQLVKPIGETLAATRERLESIEKTRGEQFARFHEHMEQITGASTGLRDETARLTKALSRPEIRGQYGEIQLRRVAELAGMTSYCDFTEQTSVRGDEGNLLRPDMVVRLPNERVIAIDAKTNTYAYIEAVNAADDAEREKHLDRFARHVAEQAKKLADKKYWSAFEGSPEFVVMFVPGDHFIDAALSRRPDLLDDAAQRNVILASPSTLIGLLRAVAVGWGEQRLAEEAKELYKLGRELHERAAIAFEHAAKLGDSIRQSVERYNKFVGSIETRVVPTLRRFEDAGVKSGRELPATVEVTVLPRGMQALPGAEHESV